MPRAWQAPRTFEGQPAVECFLVLAGRSSWDGCLSAWCTPRLNSCYGILCLFAVMTGPFAWPFKWSQVLRNIEGCHAADGHSLVGVDDNGNSCTVCYADLSGCSAVDAFAALLVSLLFWCGWVLPTFCCCHGWKKTDCVCFPLKTAAVTGWEREEQGNVGHEMQTRLMTP
jgi:hypothetical protein